MASVLSRSPRVQRSGLPASFPGRCAVLPARGWADMRAGWHRTLLWAAVATGAHSIRTCRRTLSITEATM